MNNLSKEQISRKIETLVKDNKLKTKEDLKDYLTDLKNKGILTKAQIDELYSLYEKSYDIQDDEKNTQVRRMMTRTPQKQDFDNSKSYGFSQVSFLVINLLTLTLAVVMINLLCK